MKQTAIKKKNKKGHDKNYIFSRAGFAHILLIILILAIGLVIFYFFSSTYIGTVGDTKDMWNAAHPTPTTDSSATSSDWKTYANEEYGFEIQYPPQAKLLDEGPEFSIYINNGEYPFGSYVTVDVNQNTNNLTMQEIGNNTFATDSPEPYDLDWSQTTFAGLPAITTLHVPPGDLGPQTIYLFKSPDNDTDIYVIWYSAVDDSNSSEFKNLANQVLSTFEFTNLKISKAEAEEIVKNLSEIKELLDKYPAYNVDVESLHQNKWTVHVYTLPENTNTAATYGYYSVDVNTGEVKKQD